MSHDILAIGCAAGFGGDRTDAIACWLRRLLKAIAKRADSLRRISRTINRRGSMRMGRMPIRSLLTGGFTFAISKHCGPTTSRQAVRRSSRLESNLTAGGLFECRRHFSDLVLRIAAFIPTLTPDLRRTG
jgi:hypothetical protein